MNTDYWILTDANTDTDYTDTDYTDTDIWNIWTD